MAARPQPSGDGFASQISTMSKSQLYDLMCQVKAEAGGHMMATSNLVPIFIDTSLDTHLAIAISPDSDVATFKTKLDAEHPLYFPTVGPIVTKALMTSRNGRDFHLADSLLISTILDPIQRSCFLKALLANNDSAFVDAKKKKKKKRKSIDSDLPEISGDTCRSCHEGGNVKRKKESNQLISKLLPSNECKTSDIATVRIATEEGAITERATELGGSSSFGNALSCKELASQERKNLLILDINGILADIISDNKYKQYADFKLSGKSGFKRPFYVEFLKFCFANFEVGVWSSRTWRNLKNAVDILFGEMQNKLLFCWDQSKCTDTNFKIEGTKPLFLKELSKLWENVEHDLPWEKGRFTPSNTLLVDDSPYKALRNPPNTAIFPCAYSFKNKEDNSLSRGGDIRSYLEKIARAKNVPEFVKEHPFGQPAIGHAHPQWEYYLSILSALKDP